MTDQLQTIDVYLIMSKAADAAREEMEKNKAKNNHHSLYQYDDVVMNVLKQYGPTDKAERRQFYLDVQRSAREEDAKAKTPFGKWSGFTIVANVLDGVIAWLTPGWAEVRQYLS